MAIQGLNSAKVNLSAGSPSTGTTQAKVCENSVKILGWQTNLIEKKPIEMEATVAEESEKREQRIEDVVVLFTCIEEGDDEAVAKKAVGELASSLEKLKA